MCFNSCMSLTKIFHLRLSECYLETSSTLALKETLTSTLNPHERFGVTINHIS